MAVASWAGVTIGINPNPGNPGNPYQFWSNLFADMKALGLGFLRFQLSWNNIELTQGNYSWTVLDDAVQHCNAAGVPILYTLRGAPSWALANPSQLATSEPFYFPDPTLMAGFANQVATRYNGGSHGHIDMYGYNEDFNIRNTPTGNTFTLNQTLTGGVPVSSFAITSSGFTPLANTILYIGGYSSADHPTLSQAVNLSDTTVFVNSFTPSVTYSAGTTINISYIGFNNSPYTGLYNAIGGVKPSTGVQPARDPFYAVPVVKAVHNALRSAGFAGPIGLPCVYWTQPINSGIPNTPVSNYTAFMGGLYSGGVAGFFDFIDFHYYSGATDPNTGDNQTSTIGQAITDMQTVASNNGDAGRSIMLSEFGCSVPNNCTAQEAATHYSEILYKIIPDCPNPKNRFAFFTLDYSTSSPSGNSLVIWNGTTYIAQPTYNTVQSFIYQCQPGFVAESIANLYGQAGILSGKFYQGMLGSW